ncbi:hypothetical protein AURDEDRAFT_113639 [Auricularia subglabra TFB-10046 SS5]|nr:hypothetical protein AURDEDRAFT_113639 [Auricularia subglabra TFB-10046 SS5]
MMQFAFTFPDPLHTTLFSMDPDAPAFSVRTAQGTTLIEKHLSVRNAHDPLSFYHDSGLDEELDQHASGSESVPVVRIHWRRQQICVCESGEDHCEKSLDDFMPRERWYGHSRTFVSENVTYIWRDWPFQSLMLYRQKETKPVAIFRCGYYEQWTLHVDEKATEILDSIVVTALVMAKLRCERKRGLGGDV